MKTVVIERMSAKKKKALAGMCVFLSCLLGVFLIYLNRYNIGPIAVPVHFNAEIQKEHAGSLSVRTWPGGFIHTLTATAEFEAGLSTTVVHAELSQGFLIERLELLLPERDAGDILSGIDNIAVFIGNSPFYFSAARLSGLRGIQDGGAVSYHLSDDFIYKKPLLGKWINWQGNLNFCSKALLAPFMYPWLFFPLYILVFAFFMFLYKDRRIVSKLANYVKNHELLLIALIVLFAFMLRFGGYVRYSSELDELATAEFSRPDRPLLNTFYDPGNPPFYYMLLRCFYTLFGWTEKTGRMLSVLTGTLLVLSVYFYTKKYAGTAAAFFSSAAISAGELFIIISQNQRCYILLMVLAVLISAVFLELPKKHSAPALLLYTGLSILIVNTHYYGTLYVISHFIFYIFAFRRDLNLRKILAFIFCNMIIMLSFLPFFLFTALGRGLLNRDFNAGIPQYGPVKTAVITAALLLFSFIVYKPVMSFMRRKGVFEGRQELFIDYSVFTCFAVIIIALLFSLKRPIFDLKYLQICFPFVITGLFAFLLLKYQNKYLRFASVTAAVCFIILSYHVSPRTSAADVSRETQYFIDRDAEAHNRYRSAIIEKSDGLGGYYKITKAEQYQEGEPFDVLYVNPVGYDDRKYVGDPDYIFKDINRRYHVEKENTIRIVVNDDKHILKKYF